MTEQITSKSLPNSTSLEALKGEISEPIQTVSQKPSTKDQEVTVRLVEKGAGMVGLEDAKDNQEWAGIFNHIMKTARVATFLADELKKTGVDIDSDLVLNTILVSHAGRRQWDESSWYPERVKNAESKSKKGDTTLAVEILKEAGIPQIVMDAVNAHGIGTTYPIDKMDTWEKKLALYADFRTSQSLMSLRERFDDLAKRAVPAGRLSQEQLDAIEQWAFQTEKEVFSHLTIKPEELNESFPPQPRWEQYLRRLYIQDAEEGIFARISELHKRIQKKEITQAELEKEFPETTWWGSYVREIFDKQQGQPYHPRVGKQVGITRAIAFYKSLENSETTNKDLSS